MIQHEDFERRTTLTFERALERHATCKLVSEEFAKRGDADAGLHVWEALVTADELPVDSFAEAVRITMPIDCVPVVRTRAGISASFAFERMCAHYDPKGDFYKAANQGWAEFEERRRLANNVEEGYGCDKSASWELARDITQVRDQARVEEIANMAGRMYKAMGGGPKTPTDEPHEVVGVRTGGELERLLAEELTQLMDPELTDQASIRILEKQSQQYRMRGKSTASRGPLVLLTDESGSMHDDGHGDRNSWAKACCVALTRIAHEGNRMVSNVHFATGTDITKLPPGDHMAVLQMTRHFLNGGTDIATGLAVAAREVGDLAKQGYVGADIVLITDGEDRNYQAMEHVLSLAQAQGVRLWLVAIECQIDDASPIVRRASQVIRVGGTRRADMVADLRKAAMNVVTPEEQQAADKAARQAMN